MLFEIFFDGVNCLIGDGIAILSARFFLGNIDEWIIIHKLMLFQFVEDGTHHCEIVAVGARGKDALYFGIR